MSYRKFHHTTPNHNYLCNKLQKQLAAYQYIMDLSSGKEIINIDESIIDNTDNRRHGWLKY